MPTHTVRVMWSCASALRMRLPHTFGGTSARTTIGPIQAFVIGFPTNDLFEGRIAKELELLSDVGEIRIVDAVFVLRDGEGIVVVGVSDLDDEQRAELRAPAVGALVGLGVAGGEGAAAGAALAGSMDADALHRAQVIAVGLADGLPDGSSAVLVIEHLWAVPLRYAVRDAGGLVLAHRSLTLEDLVGLGVAAAAEGERIHDRHALPLPAPAKPGCHSWLLVVLARTSPPTTGRCSRSSTRPAALRQPNPQPNAT